MSRRIAVLTGIYPPDIGGPATSVPELARALTLEGHRVRIVTLADRPSSSEEPFEVIRVPRGDPLPRRMAAVLRATLSFRPEIVFANGLHLEAALLPRTPVVAKIVGDWAWERAVNRGLVTDGIEAFQTAPLAGRVRALRGARSVVTRRASRVIVPSAYLGRLVGGWGVDQDRIRVVPNAGPPPLDPPKERPRRLLYVGRLVRWKHVDDLLHAMAEIDGVELEIIGSGPEDSELRSLAARLGLLERVTFRGALSREETWRRLREDAGLLVLPSSYEGMPHVVLEAFAAGVPVVASAAGGTPELVEHGVSGLLYRCRAVGELRAALERGLEPATARKLVEGGSKVARRLTLEGMTAATRSVLEEVAEPA